MNWRAFVASVFTGLITTILAESLGLSERISPVDIVVLNNMWVRVLILTISITVAVYATLRFINNRQKKLRQKNAPRVFSTDSEPDNVLDEMVLEDFDVLWHGKYGTSRGRSRRTVYVEGPFCPEEGRKLKSRTVPKWLLFDEEAWVCPDCGNTYSRSTTHYLDEDNVVKDEMEQQFESRE
jgi:hypothetical protein